MIGIKSYIHKGTTEPIPDQIHRGATRVFFEKMSTKSQLEKSKEIWEYGVSLNPGKGYVIEDGDKGFVISPDETVAKETAAVSFAPSKRHSRVSQEFLNMKDWKDELSKLKKEKHEQQSSIELPEIQHKPTPINRDILLKTKHSTDSYRPKRKDASVKRLLKTTRTLANLSQSASFTNSGPKVKVIMSVFLSLKAIPR